jgi:hypothetical protein
MFVCRVSERTRQRGRKVFELVVGEYIRGLVFSYDVDEMSDAFWIVL